MCHPSNSDLVWRAWPPRKKIGRVWWPLHTQLVSLPRIPGEAYKLCTAYGHVRDTNIIHREPFFACPLLLAHCNNGEDCFCCGDDLSSGEEKKRRRLLASPGISVHSVPPCFWAILEIDSQIIDCSALSDIGLSDIGMTVLVSIELNYAACMIILVHAREIFSWSECKQTTVTD